MVAQEVRTELIEPLATNSGDGPVEQSRPSLPVRVGWSAREARQRNGSNVRCDPRIPAKSGSSELDELDTYAGCNTVTPTARALSNSTASR